MKTPFKEYFTCQLPLGWRYPIIVCFVLSIIFVVTCMMWSHVVAKLGHQEVSLQALGPGSYGSVAVYVIPPTSQKPI